MINVKEELAKLLKEQVADLTVEEIGGMIEVPQNSEMGDYSFPCFRLAKVMRKAPPLIAKGIADGLNGNPMFQKVEQVNAYVNMFIAREPFITEVVEEAMAKGDEYGKSNVGQGRPEVVEFSSPNIAKPFHIGHIRSTVIGNSINLIHQAMGYNVIRINHLGDYGTQFGKMIVAFRHWGNEDDVRNNPIPTLLSYYTKFHVEAEKDPSLNDEARKTFT
ncbi:MAG: arginine--tRNA ligase, partial [Firmicutes bacterium]|nr:arginine--tRNA ligase [Bacillota bacterium]